MDTLIIDPEFHALIPPLSTEERAQLEANLRADGCRDALVVWMPEPETPCSHCGEIMWQFYSHIPGDTRQEFDCQRCHERTLFFPIIVDGHNRYEICSRLDIEFDTVEVEREFNDRNAAKVWIIQNQFGRRNLTPYVRAELALKLEGVYQEKAKENQGTRTDILPNSAKSIQPVNTRVEIAKQAHVGKDTVARVKFINAKADDATKDRLRTGEISVNQVYTEIKREENRNKPRPIPPPLPEGQYSVIYADPPWQYEFSKDSADDIEEHYPTMTVQEICNLKIPATENAVLFLWATAPKLLEAHDVMDSWGFEYKTHAVWDKDHIGMGYWFRGQHELLLVGTKGHFSPPPETVRVSSMFKERRTKHSKKPDLFYALIESMFPDHGPYLELFARKQHNEKWITWGNENVE